MTRCLVNEQNQYYALWNKSVHSVKYVLVKNMALMAYGAVMVAAVAVR